VAAMIKILKQYLSIILPCLFLANLAFAELHLHLTQSETAAVPIAVVPFSQQQDDSSIAAVVSNDLKNSGMFQTMPEAGMQRKPNHIANVDFNYWRHSDRDYLVIGYINNMGDDKYQVTFALLNVVLGSQNQGDSPVIISKRFVVKSSEMRPLAHRIADIIYHQITGIKG
jgi:TolB protein